MTETGAMSHAIALLILLMLANLALSALLAGLMLAFQEHLLDYQLAHLNVPADTDLVTARSWWQRVGRVQDC